jgi:hypothetical protein
MARYTAKLLNRSGCVMQTSREETPGYAAKAVHSMIISMRPGNRIEIEYEA